MFGMDLTLKLSDFKLVFTRPKDMIIGCVSQFAVMPLLAFGLSRLFGFDAALTAGMVLVGTCPGGTSSNVITYLSKGRRGVVCGDDKREYDTRSVFDARHHLPPFEDRRFGGCT